MNSAFNTRLLDSYAADPALNGFFEDGRSIKMLVVDDSKTLRESLLKTFAHVGY